MLEIGTGTGWNAGRLAHRLGAEQVYSIDLDPDMVDSATAALGSLGIKPSLRSGDGYAGWAEAAPFDRIIATCAVDHIPPAWIDQLAVGGRIVAPLIGDACALMVLDKTGGDEVTGRFDPYQVAFMPLRDRIDSPLPAGRVLGGHGRSIGQYGTTTLDPATFEDMDRDLLLFLLLHLPTMSTGSVEAPTGPAFMLSTQAGAAYINRQPTNGRWNAVQHGQRVWDTAEHVAALWQHLNKPGRDRYGISALNRQDRQYVWLDHPDSDCAWPLPL